MSRFTCRTCSRSQVAKAKGSTSALRGLFSPRLEDFLAVFPLSFVVLQSDGGHFLDYPHDRTGFVAFEFAYGRKQKLLACQTGRGVTEVGLKAPDSCCYYTCIRDITVNLENEVSGSH